MSIVSSVAFVPRGYASEFPKSYDIDEIEYERINQLSKLKLEDARADLQSSMEDSNKANGNGEETTDGAEGVLQTSEEVDDELKEYNLDTYDDDEEEAETEGPAAMFSNIRGLAYHENGEKDPYITIDPQEQDDLEREEMQILPTDSLLLAARTEDNLSHVEVYVYEPTEENLYVHHDFLLPTFPLCLEWLDYKVGTSDNAPGNYVAVGTFDPEIEIWDLDIIDAVYPAAVLGAGASQVNKKKKKKSKKINDSYHTDAVLALSSNRNAHNLLVSGSADTTLKLWDLSTCNCVKSFTYHSDKVSCLDWYSKAPSVLLSGSYDKTAKIADLRLEEAPSSFQVTSDVENVAWDQHSENNFFIGTDNGIVYYCDARNLSKSVWQLQAHDGPISCLSVNPSVPSFVATGSTDRLVKLWNTSDSSPKMVVSRDLDVGRVFTCSFTTDESTAFHLAASGSKGVVRVWDTATNPGVRKAFESRVTEEVTKKERIVQLEDRGAGEDSSDDDDDYEDIEDDDDQDAEMS